MGSVYKLYYCNFSHIPTTVMNLLRNVCSGCNLALKVVFFKTCLQASIKLKARFGAYINH